MNETASHDHERQADRKPPEQGAVGDPVAQYDHLVLELTEAEQKAIVGGWWTDAGMFVWRGGW